MTLLTAAWAVFRKDLRAELRTRYALNSLLLFTVCTMTALSISTATLTVQRNPDLPLIHAALIWVAILFAALTGLARAFVQEEDARTSIALRLAAPAVAVYLGKLLFNLLLLLLLAALIVALGVVFLRIRVADPLLLGLLLAMGSAGLATTTTLIGAIIARASGRGALFAVLSLPLILPVLVVAVQGSTLALLGVRSGAGMQNVVTLVGYTLAMLVVALMVFQLVWEA